MATPKTFLNFLELSHDRPLYFPCGLSVKFKSTQPRVFENKIGLTKLTPSLSRV